MPIEAYKTYEFQKGCGWEDEAALLGLRGCVEEDENEDAIRGNRQRTRTFK